MLAIIKYPFSMCMHAECACAFEYTAWCSEIGSLASLDAPEFYASTDVREPISLHQAVHMNVRATTFLRGTAKFKWDYETWHSTLTPSLQEWLSVTPKVSIAEKKLCLIHMDHKTKATGEGLHRSPSIHVCTCVFGCLLVHAFLCFCVYVCMCVCVCVCVHAHTQQTDKACLCTHHAHLW